MLPCRLNAPKLSSELLSHQCFLFQRYMHFHVDFDVFAVFHLKGSSTSSGGGKSKINVHVTFKEFDQLREHRADKSSHPCWVKEQGLFM